jgi:hypothetical protein
MGLVEEITILFPKAVDINVNSGECSKEIFTKNCTHLFEKGHIFASFKQLDHPGADMVLEAWEDVLKSHTGKHISCSFSLYLRKKTTLLPLENPAASTHEHPLTLNSKQSVLF